MSGSSVNRNKTINRLFFMLGFFSTMPIVGIPIESQYLTLFNLCFIVTFVCLFVSTISNNGVRIIINSNKINIMLLLLFFAIEIVAALTGFIVLPSNWSNQIANYLLKSLEYVAMFLMIMSWDEDEKYALCSAFIKGLFFGCVINALWGIMQAVLWYVDRISVNLLLFDRAIRNASHVGIHVNTYYGIRVSGLNTDPAHLGALLPILYYYSIRGKNIYLIILSVACLVFSGSTTALLAIAFCSMIMLFNLDSNKKVSDVTSHSIIRFILSIACIIIMFVALRNTLIVQNLGENAIGFMSRVLEVYGNATNSTRGVYYSNALDAILKRLPYALFGTGLGTSGYAYYDIPMAAAQGVFDVESTYLSYLFDVGIVGLFVYCILLFNLFAIIRKNNDNEISLLLMGVLLTTIATGVSYHYIITSYQIIPLFFMAIIYRKRPKTYCFNVQ